MNRRLGMVVMLVGLVIAGCGGAVVGVVSDGTYSALVPTSEQLADPGAGDLPGGFTALHAGGAESVAARIGGETITFAVDGVDVVTRQVVERIDVVDSEGSGPLKAQKQVLVLGPEPLVLGDLTITSPVIWPGSFEESPIITVKPRNPDERGPAVSCRSDEPCLLLSRGESPTGRYENANNPALNENPIATIEVTADAVEFTLVAGGTVRIDLASAGSTRACGLAETPVWEVPAEIALPPADPVLAFTACPSNPGAPIRMVIMDRSAIPVLAPLGAQGDGAWCDAGPSCLEFAPV